MMKGVGKLVGVDEIPDILKWSALQMGCSDVLSLAAAAAALKGGQVCVCVWVGVYVIKCIL